MSALRLTQLGGLRAPGHLQAHRGSERRSDRARAAHSFRSPFCVKTARRCRVPPAGIFPEGKIGGRSAALSSLCALARHDCHLDRAAAPPGRRVGFGVTRSQPTLRRAAAFSGRWRRSH
ncbi:MAG: hypothetical protein B7Z04_03075 [Rhodobacterales bacterium 32-66-9]|nr:MAG: hypothetical protein B7Z04_03075 [Rhodobacterales bacterium 32-66-9]